MTHRSPPRSITKGGARAPPRAAAPVFMGVLILASVLAAAAPLPHPNDPDAASDASVAAGGPAPDLASRWLVGYDPATWRTTQGQLERAGLTVIGDLDQTAAAAITLDPRRNDGSTAAVEARDVLETLVEHGLLRYHERDQTISGTGTGRAHGQNAAGTQTIHDAPTPEAVASSDPYWFRELRMNEVWDEGSKGAGTTICMVDSGLAFDHPEFSGTTISPLSIDIIDGDDDPTDEHGHGTHTTGLIFAAHDGLGTQGAAPDAVLLVVRALDHRNLGTWFGVAEGILACADRSDGRLIINLSLGGRDSNVMVTEALMYARAKRDAAIFAAAGNHNGALDFPARSPYTVAVGCTDASSNRCPFSAKGDGLHLMAPGHSILSTASPEGFRIDSGTSMSAPLASGAAALVWERHPDNRANDIYLRLAAGARDLGTAGHEPKNGFGLIDTVCAITCAVPAPNPPINLIATSKGNGTVELEWTAPADPLSQFSVVYQVEATTQPGGPYETIVQTVATNFQQEDISIAVPVYYQVRALNVGGLSSATAPACGDPAWNDTLVGAASPRCLAAQALLGL